MTNVLTKKEIDAILMFCDNYNITKYLINLDGSIDINQNVNINYARIKELPIKINEVNGDFEINNCMLKSLVNMPNTINGDFSVRQNSLRSLEGCPRIVTGDFDIEGNYLTSTYVGDYDVLIKGEVIYLHNNEFSRSFLNEIENINELYEDTGMYDISVVKLIFKYQRHFEIWDNDHESLNKKNYYELIAEIKDGLL